MLLKLQLSSLGTSPCGQYVDGIGYDIKTYGDRNYQIDWRGEGTFYCIWNGDYSLSCAFKDICVLCFQSDKMHKYLLHMCNSYADIFLFVNGENGGINYSGGAGRGEAQKDTTKDNNTSEDELVT